MKATTNPSPLRHIRVDPALEVDGAQAAEITPLVLLHGEAAAAVRRRRAVPARWVQVHVGVMCFEQEKHTRRVQDWWQAGVHASHWVWPDLGDAQRYLGGLTRREAGQPAVVSAWAPAWWSTQFHCSLDIGTPVAGLLRDLCWSMPLRSVPWGWMQRSAGEGAQLTRLRLRRQVPDTDPRAWDSTALQAKDSTDLRG